MPKLTMEEHLDCFNCNGVLGGCIGTELNVALARTVILLVVSVVRENQGIENPLFGLSELHR